MQIQLKQSEIIQALKLYISTQGINLNGKTVEVAFTAGRKETGLSADIDIQDIEGSAVLGAIPSGPVKREMAYPCAVETAETPVTEEATPVEEEQTPVKGASLFG